MLYQERDSSAHLSQAQSSLVQWGLDGKLRTILDTISACKTAIAFSISPLLNLSPLILLTPSTKLLLIQCSAIEFKLLGHIIGGRYYLKIISRFSSEFVNDFINLF